ncbi:MAG TPA: serine/threonine-protein kinase [Planctomycetaceae bacterium]|nr:serine/threonine-protein kinase [Planctomycetaceae bacterium]
MNPPTSACPKELLSRCLQDALATTEEDQLAAHLTQCEACRCELERLAAGDREWDNAGTVLRQMSHADAADADSSHEGPEWYTPAPVDFAVDFLMPAATAGALGRLDDIEVLEVVGRGSSGIVLKGWQEPLKRLVAVKMLRPELAEHAAARKRFVREAQAAAAVIHPHVMPIHAIHAQGRLPYLIMPFLDCESLQARLDRQGSLELVELLTIAVQIAQALQAAHARGLIHRDVKPANILLEKKGHHAWLADFGLARAVDDASLTRTGVIAGTPQYMSPEQARGDAIDHRTDLFSFGSVLYAMAAGRPPFRAETTFGVLKRICSGSPRRLREIQPQTPDWFETLVDHLHQKSPKDRLGSAAEVVQLLEDCLRHVQQPAVYALPDDLCIELAPPERRTVTAGPTLPQMWLLVVFLLGGLAMSLALIPVSLILIWMWAAAPAAPNPSTTDGVPSLTTMNDSPVTGPNVTPIDIVKKSPETASAGEQIPPQDGADSAQPSPEITGDGSDLLAFNQKNKKKKKQAEPTEAPAVGDDKYASAEDAYRIGTAFLVAARADARSREPLEAALRMSRDDEFKLKVYRSLLPVYTNAEDWTLKATALEFIIAHADQPAARSLARTELLSFLRQRGKTADAAKRYEDRLKENPDDLGTLYILCEFYGRLVDDPQRAVVMFERYARIQQADGDELSVRDAADLAEQYVKAKKYQQGAELFEKTAGRDESLAAWHYKDAAAAWLKANQKKKALTAAKRSEESPPERRSDQLEYFWRRHLGDVFLDAGDAAAAVPHYEAAVALTKIDGYRKDSEQKLMEARRKAEQ